MIWGQKSSRSQERQETWTKEPSLVDTNTYEQHVHIKLYIIIVVKSETHTLGCTQEFFQFLDESFHLLASAFQLFFVGMELFTEQRTVSDALGEFQRFKYHIAALNESTRTYRWAQRVNKDLTYLLIYKIAEPKKKDGQNTVTRTPWVHWLDSAPLVPRSAPPLEPQPMTNCHSEIRRAARPEPVSPLQAKAALESGSPAHYQVLTHPASCAWNSRFPLVNWSGLSYFP